jgi:hypothetical protein
VIDSVSEYAEPVTPPGSVVVVMSIGRHPQQQPTQSQSRRLSSRPSCRWLRQPRKRKPAFRQAAHRKSPARALPRSTGPFPFVVTAGTEALVASPPRENIITTALRSPTKGTPVRLESGL